MLVLSRKVGERIQIGDNITLVVSRVVGNRVTLGIEAPNDVRIVRSELAPLIDDFAQRSEHKADSDLAPVGGRSFENSFAAPYIPRAAR